MPRIGVVGLLMVAVLAPAQAFAGVRVKPAVAMPGQVVIVSGSVAKRSTITIGGRPARVVQRRAHRLSVLVPALGPGRKRLVVRTGHRRASTALRVRKGFGGKVAPTSDALLAATATIGPAGGTVLARGADGTTYQLTVPAGALSAPTAITLTPLSRLAGLPGVDPAAPAVQFAPDGLQFALPAVLRVTPAKPIKDPVAITYEGTGTDVEPGAARADGAAVETEIRHFSGGGTHPVTEAEFRAFLTRWSRQRMDAATAGAFYFILQRFGLAWCAADATCALVERRAEQFQQDLATAAGCGQLIENAFVAELADDVRLLIAIDAERRLVGLPPSDQASCRAALIAAMEKLVHDTARTDPLGVSGPCAGPVPADLDGDGKVREVECAIYIAREAALQGFTGIEVLALDDARAGLKKVLDDGNALCQQAKFKEGHDLLARGQSNADGLLADEYTKALNDCQPKVTVAPDSPSVEIGKTQSFSATSNDPSDTSFQWTVDGGQIGTTDGQFTAPSTPGTVTVTATSTTNPGHHGTTTVHITCPSDKVEDAGACKTVTITIDPTSATLAPGGTQQFTATITGTSDTRVDWTTTGAGSVSTAGFYTAPTAPGTYTVTATSHRFPSKAATAQVTVGTGTVQVTARQEDPGAVANITAYTGVSGEERTVTDTDPNTYGHPPSWTAPLLGGSSGSYSAVASQAVPEGSDDEPVAQGTASASATTSANANVSGGQLSASVSASGQLVAHGEQRTFSGLTDIHVSSVGQLTLTFTVSGGSVHMSCNASFATIPDDPGPAAAVFDGTGVTVTRTSPGPSQGKLGISPHGTPTASATLEAGTYSLVMYAGASGRVYTLNQTPGDLDYTGGSSASCATS